MYNTTMSSSQIGKHKRYPAVDPEEISGSIVAGVDESGRGPWAGPVVAAAVVPGQHDFDYADSKLLTPLIRKRFFKRIVDSCRIGVGIASPEEIDTHNILVATRMAISRAVESLDVSPDVILIDGKYLEFDRRCICIVKGDVLDFRIAAASIVAKVIRDAYMTSLSKILPEFSFGSHKGYGTDNHRKELVLAGATPWHRLSYSPVRSVMTSSLLREWLSKGIVSRRRFASVSERLGGDGNLKPEEVLRSS